MKAFGCEHVDQVTDVEPLTPDGCQECLETGGAWVHLRLCMTCGHVGCCDSSANRHATRHANNTGHAIIRSFEPGDRWGWCYLDKTTIRFDG